MFVYVVFKEPWNSDDQSVKTGSTDTISSVSSSSTHSSDGPITEIAEVTWYPLLGQSDDMAFFYDKSDDEKAPLTEEVKNAVIAGGYNILSSSNEIYKAFLSAGVQGRTTCTLVLLAEQAKLSLLNNYLGNLSELSHNLF